MKTLKIAFLVRLQNNSGHSILVRPVIFQDQLHLPGFLQSNTTAAQVIAWLFTRNMRSAPRWSTVLYNTPHSIKLDLWKQTLEKLKTFPLLDSMLFVNPLLPEQIMVQYFLKIQLYWNVLIIVLVVLFITIFLCVYSMNTLE